MDHVDGSAGRFTAVENRVCLRNQLFQPGVDFLEGAGWKENTVPMREMNREQTWLLPSTLDELVPGDHPARFVAEFVDALDREELERLWVDLEGDPLGAPAYHPRALWSVWLYGFITNVRSCRKLEPSCRDQIPYLWMTGWQHPDHNTLWRFYQRHRRDMRELFRGTVRTAVTLGWWTWRRKLWTEPSWPPTRRSGEPSRERSCANGWTR